MTEELLDPRYTVDVKDKFKHEIFMSAALLRLLATKVQEGDDVADMYLNAAIQQEICLELLADRDEYGKPGCLKEPHKRFNLMSATQGKELFEWAAKHILDFFIGGVESVQVSIAAQAKAVDDLTESLTESSDGTKDLPKESPSVGSSESDQAA